MTNVLGESKLQILMEGKERMKSFEFEGLWETALFFDQNNSPPEALNVSRIFSLEGY